MLMPKKKKSDNWQHDCLEKEKNIKRSKKKRGNVAIQGREKREKNAA